MSYSSIITEAHNKVGLIKLNRPEVLNALSSDMMMELSSALKDFDQNPGVGCIVLTGNEKAFAAGADIAEMKNNTYMDVYNGNFLTDHWEQATKCRKPVIAAVSGYALGGGCELAMMCDFIIAADNARFGQPEINLGIIPGLGGTQRLTRAIGKAKAMEMCLTGRILGAEEAERSGLVAKVVATADLLEQTLKTAAEIADKSLPALLICKESVNRAFESSLAEGLLFERRQFHAMFATEDQKEGMSAFVEKRAAKWNHK